MQNYFQHTNQRHLIPLEQCIFLEERGEEWMYLMRRISELQMMRGKNELGLMKQLFSKLLPARIVLEYYPQRGSHILRTTNR